MNTADGLACNLCGAKILLLPVEGTPHASKYCTVHERSEEVCMACIGKCRPTACLIEGGVLLA